MRRILISLAAAGTALAFAAPASAQYFPQPQPAYGYGNGYGHNGYGQNYGQLRSMQARIDGIQRQIEQLKARRMISRGEAHGLRSESRNLEARLMQSARYGLNPMEARNIDYGIARLERHVAQQARNGRGYGYSNGNYGNGYNSAYNGYGHNNGAYADSDRDGRDDNTEHDRWHGQHDDNNDD